MSSHLSLLLSTFPRSFSSILQRKSCTSFYLLPIVLSWRRHLDERLYRPSGSGAVRPTTIVVSGMYKWVSCTGRLREAGLSADSGRYRRWSGRMADKGEEARGRDGQGGRSGLGLAVLGERSMVGGISRGR